MSDTETLSAGQRQLPRETDFLERVWNDIANEHFREYDFGTSGKVLIKEPRFLNVSSSGGHRVLDANGESHYIPPGWIHLRWCGTPHFVK